MPLEGYSWTAISEFGTYCLCEQRRFRRACASAQSRQNLRCSLIQAVSQEEPSDRKPDPWPLWMAGHAQLKFVMTECSKTQIRLTGLSLRLWLFFLRISFITFDSLRNLSIPLESIWAISWGYGTFRPPSTHSSNAHAQPSSVARCLNIGRTLRLFPYFMCANSEGSGETARLRRLAWAFAGRLCDKYHNLMTWLI